MVSETCDWLVDSVNKPNRIHLIGNHDIHYMFDSKSFRCSGYTQWKHLQINDLVPRKTWDKLKWYHFLDDTWLLTHAGLHNSNLPNEIKALNNNKPKFIQSISDYLDTEIINGLRRKYNNENSWIFNAGRSRGGFFPVGGIIWCDYEDEFYPIKGLNQVVGHTSQGLGFPKWCLQNNNDKISYPPYDKFNPSPEILKDPNLSTNIGLDVHGIMHFAIWNGNKFKVKSYYDL